MHSKVCLKHSNTELYSKPHKHTHACTENNQGAFFFFALQTVDKLREHLNRHLPRLGKKKIDSLVVNYVAKLVGTRRACVCVLVRDKERPYILLQVIFIQCLPLLFFSGRLSDTQRGSLGGEGRGVFHSS